MAITTAELQENLSKYLILVATEEILIMENGKIIAMLSNPNQNRVEMAQSLFGILPTDITLEESKKERLAKI